MEDEVSLVLKKVQLCMGSLVGGSGHLASFDIVQETFLVTAVEVLEGGMKRYRFAAEAYYESEFTEYTDDHVPQAVPLNGSIVLDQDWDLVRDRNGRVMLEPWDCFLPPKASGEM